MPLSAAFHPLPQKSPDISVDRRPDGSILISSNHPIGDLPTSIGHLFAARAAEHPERPFILQRRPVGGPWRGVNYGEALRASEGIGQSLLEMGLTSQDTVLILSSNSVEHALLMLGCYISGIPCAPISPAFSLGSAGHGKLRHMSELFRPRAVFVQNAELFSGALHALRTVNPDLHVLTAEETSDTVSIATLANQKSDGLLSKAFDRVAHNTIGKFLFTSGSTGMPKCVPQTHGMMCHLIAAQEGLRALSVEAAEPPQTLDWMPWSHISAGNITFNTNIQNGGTLFIDDGKPVPGQFETTIKNLYEVSPQVFGSAPIAFAMLASAMEQDPKLRQSFFRNLIYMGYGGATLSQDVNARLQTLAVAETGKRIPMVTMYGATETQGVTVVHWETDQVGLIGLPLPGTVMKLAPSGEKLEVRVKGPTVAPGYFRDPKRTKEAFDEEGFYCLGDAARFADENDPSQGLVFDGRITEDFKLDSGTWVSVGTLRPEILTVCSPLVQDVVITGQDKPFLGLLVWPAHHANPSGQKTQSTTAMQEMIAAKLRTYNQSAGGSSRRIGRFTILEEAPSVEAGELTDKGYINQRGVLSRRREIVDRLYATILQKDIIDLS